MNTYTTTDPTQRHGRGGCGGCGGYDPTAKPCACCGQEEACGLECLERPLFSAGMVLSDSDLTALVDWTRTRLGLQRYHDGWGVVCGLDVRCDPDRPGWVVVEPGYAVGCCGEDVVLCEPQYVDLTGCCAVDNPCPEPDPVKPDPDQGGGLASRDPCGDVVVDLLLTPQNTPAVAGLVGGCGCEGGCEDARIVPTRQLEGALVETVRVSFPSTDPVVAAAERAQAKYSRCHDIVGQYVAESDKDDADPSAVIEWLRQHVDDPPCDWWTTTCAALKAADGGAQVDEVVTAALFELVMDCRQRLVRRACSPCADDRVGLARVWLSRVEDAKGTTECVVTRVDAYPPHRRELGPTARPVPPGTGDLAPFIWQRWEQVCHRWLTLAPAAARVPLPLPTTTSDLLFLFEQTDRLWWWCGDRPPDPVVVSTRCLGDRVVGFQSRRGKGNDDVESVRGIGPQYAKLLRAEGISTVDELSMVEPPVIGATLGVGSKSAEAIWLDAVERVRDTR